MSALGVFAGWKSFGDRGEDCTVRFWDTHSWREVATMRHAASVTSLLFSSDGNRLVTTFADKSMQIRDIRPYAERQGEIDAVTKEQKQLKPYVQNLVNGSVPWDSLATNILADSTLSDAGKLAALAELHDQLGNADETATAKLVDLRTQWVTKDAVVTAAGKLDLPRAVRKALDQQIDDWTPKPKEISQDLASRLSDGSLSPEQYAEALGAAKEIAASQPDDHASLLAYGVFLYRCGEYGQCIEVLQKAEAGPKPRRYRGDRRPGTDGQLTPVTSNDVDNDEAFVAIGSV